jgi:hypothetical protein
VSRIITRLLPLLSSSRNRISRLVLLRCALALAVIAATALPERANAQAPLFATSKSLCMGDPANNNPNTCLPVTIVGVGQQVFYVIKVTNPPGQPPQNITLTEHYPAPFAPGTIGTIVCTDQLGNTPAGLLINPPVATPVISFQLQTDTTVTCTIPGTFNSATGSGPKPVNKVDVDNNEGQVQSPTAQTDVATTTQLNTDLAVTKTVSPSPIDVTGGPQTVTYTVKITNTGANAVAVDVGHWFVLHDTLALLPLSVPLYATVVAGSFKCMATPTTIPKTDCLDTTTAMNGASRTQQLIGTMAPHPMFDWSFPTAGPGSAGHIAAGATITLTWQVLIEKLPTLSCVKSRTANGLSNQVFFTLTNPDGTAANDSNNANNTAAAPLTVKLAGKLVSNCGAGQLTMTKTQVIPAPATQVAWGMPTSPPATGTVTYDITIKNTSMPAQTITIPGGQLQDFVVEGIGTPPYTRTFVSATCTSVPAAICNNPGTGFISPNGGGNPSPPGAPFPATATQTSYTFYGQQQLGWSSKSTWPLVLAPGNSITIRIAFNYYGPDCDTVPNVTPKLIDNKTQITYMATVVGAASGSPQNVQYTQQDIAHTQMQPQLPCKFVVTKSFDPSSPKTVQFGGTLVYNVTFTNNDVSRTIGTVMDSVRLTDFAYATQVPFTSAGGTCTWTGNPSVPQQPSFPVVNGTAIYTNSPSQGSPVFQFANLHFDHGAQLSCTVKITVDRPVPNNPNCSMNLAYFENAALMDVTQPYNTNVPWPPSSTYSPPPALSNPTSQNANWATLKAPLPKCYNANINKSASVNGITPAWTSPSGPPVDYTIQVTNTGTSGALTGSGTLFLWNGLGVADHVDPPYDSNPVKLTTPSSCPGTWCTPLLPVGSTTANAAASGVGIGTPPAGPPGLLAHALGNWGLTLQPPFTAGTYIKNCAVVKPGGTFTGPDYYPNYDPANPPPPVCVQVPVLTTTKLDALKKIVNETGHALNFLPTTSGVHVTCQPYPLHSSGNLALPVGATTGLPNGGSMSGTTGFVLDVPISLVPPETCTVTEPTPPAIPPGACARDMVPYWDTAISPAQPMAITAAPSAVAVTNTLRCKIGRGSLIVKKTLTDNTAIPLPAGTLFPMTVTCGPPSLTQSFSLTVNGSHTVNNIPFGSNCTVTETLPALPANLCPGTVAVWDPPPTYTPPNVVITGTTATITAHNSVRCGEIGSLIVKKDVIGPPGPVAWTFPITVTCGSTVTHFTLFKGGSQTVSNIPFNTSCSVVEGTPQTPPNVCPANMTPVWTTDYVPPLPITITGAGITETLTNTLTCRQGTTCVLPQVLNTAGACVCPPPMVPAQFVGAAGQASCVCPSGTTLVAGKCEPSPPTGSLRVEKKMAPGPAAGVPPIPPGITFPVQVACTPNGPNQTVNLTAAAPSVTLPNIIAGGVCTLTELSPVGPIPQNCHWGPVTYPNGQSATIAAQSTAGLAVQNTMVCGPLPTGSLTVNKKISAPQRGSLPNLTGVVFPVNVVCTPSGPSTTVTLTAANPSQVIRQIPVGSSCNVVEPPVQQTVSCGRPLVGVVSPPTYVPGQNVTITAPPATPSVEVDNVIGCVPLSSWTIIKTLVNLTHVPLPNVQFPVTITCNPFGSVLHLNLASTNTSSQTVNLPAGSNCTIVEGPLPPPALIPGACPGTNSLAGWTAPVYMPGGITTIQPQPAGLNPESVRIDNKFVCNP